MLAIESVLAHRALTDHDARVYRHRIAAAYEQRVAGRKADARYAYPVFAAFYCHRAGEFVLGVQPGLGVFLPRAFFQETAQQQEEGEHHNGIEIHLPTVADCRPGARQESEPDGQGDRQVHDQFSVFEMSPGSGEERSCTIQHDQRRHRQADPAQEPCVLGFHPLHVAGVQGNGEHAHLHHANPGHREPAQIFAEFSLQMFPLRAVNIGAGAVAERFELGEYVAHSQSRGVIGHIQARLLQAAQLIPPTRIRARVTPCASVSLKVAASSASS